MNARYDELCASHAEGIRLLRRGGVRIRRAEDGELLVDGSPVDADTFKAMLERERGLRIPAAKPVEPPAMEPAPVVPKPAPQPRERKPVAPRRQAASVAAAEKKARPPAIAKTRAKRRRVAAPDKPCGCTDCIPADQVLEILADLDRLTRRLERLEAR